MFHASRVAGSSDFATFFDSLPIPSDRRLRAVARFLDVSESSVKLWLSGKRNPPRAAVIALWHESRFGLSVTSSHAAYGETLARGYADAMKAENSRLSAHIAALSAELARVKLSSGVPAVAMNDPMFSGPRPPIRQNEP